MDDFTKLLDFFISSKEVFFGFQDVFSVFIFLSAGIFVWYLVRGVYFLFKGQDFRDKRKKCFWKSTFALLLMLIFIYVLGRITLFGVLKGFV